MVASMNVFDAVRRVSALIKETSIPACSLQRLLLDPLDPTQAAFYLSCGWAGNCSPLRPTYSPLYEFALCRHLSLI